ncbi:MAG: multicopper oxidase domain-containing protein [Methylococcales bacterium]
MKQRNIFKPTRISMAILIALAPAALQLAHAGAGWGDNVDANNQNVKVATFYANSPSGLREAASCFDVNGVSTAPIAGGVCDSGTALRKFVNELPGLGAANANNLGQYIPVAAPEKWVNMNGVQTNDDYYEIAIVEYAEKLHSDLPKATRLRGYVQLETPWNSQLGRGSKHVALKYPDGTPILDNAGLQVYAYDNPHYLGPLISATQGIAVRIKYTNYLPFGGMKGAESFIPVDNSMQSAGTGPDGVTPYKENRAAIHWHGGDTPWISDGTPHQWIAPAGEIAAYDTGYGKGVSAQNVPDMPDPGRGSGTFYFPNNLSGRFMFYHDHTTGLTRLNVYAGLAAGYLLTDNTETTLVEGGSIPNVDPLGAAHPIAQGTLPVDQIPLIIQDKTFVPKDIAQQDAKWNKRSDGTMVTALGEYGDLWFPHVYETNQDPNSWDGTNPVGRWDWGPWFWPIFPAKYSLPTGDYGDASTTPEAFMDTTVINGTAYPTTKVDPKAYRLRILNACNDRFINLGFYVADTTSAQALAVKNDTGVLGTEVPMVPFELGGTRADGSAIVFPETGGLNGTGWGTADAMNHPSGVPDPLSAGPDIIQIGTEGGFLPNAVRIPSTPINYEFNRRSITVLNVFEHGLYMGPAERADIVVDFSAYAGKTLILYNDAPAPLPAGDPRIDYYTGNGDNTGSGGSETTKPGYGPNTRTMMRIEVSANGVPQVFDDQRLIAAIPHAYAAEQDRPVIPQAAYNNAFGTTDANNYAKISTGSIAQPTFDYTPSGNQTIMAVNLVGGGTGYTTPPTVVFTPPAGAQGSGAIAKAGIGIGGITLTKAGSGYITPPTVVFDGGKDPQGNPVDWVGNPNYASATATIIAGRVQGINVTNPGSFSQMPNVTFVGGAAGGASPAVTSLATVKSSGMLTSVVLTNAGGLANGGVEYTADPVITFVGGGGTGATAAVTTSLTKKLPVLNKGIHELFEPVFGRMNATFAVELPFTNAGIQTTIPLSYVDEATESFKDGEFQIWKITHNGVDTHPVHFHLVNVQVLNRVGWDGTVKPPYENEVGWKETVRMNPLEDIYVVTKAKTPQLPGFGLPESYRLEDPSQPEGSSLGFTPIDPLTGFPAVKTNKWENFDNEYVWHCHILGHEENDFMRPVVFHPFVIDSVVGSPTTGEWIVPGTSGNGISGKLAKPAAPTNPAAQSLAQGVVLNWADTATTEFRFDVLRANGLNAVDGYAKIGQALANELGYTDVTAAEVTEYSYKVVAVGAKGTNESVSASVTTGQFTAPGAPVLTVVANNATSVALSWPDVTGEVSYQVLRTDDLGVVTTIAPNLAMNSNGFIDNTVVPNSSYSYQVIAVNNVGPSASNVAPATTPVAAVANVVATSTLDTVKLSWSNPNAGVTTVTVTRDGTDISAQVVNGSSLSDTGLAANTSYDYVITVTGANGTASTTITTATGLLSATGLTVSGTTADTADLSWKLPAQGNLNNVQVLRDGVVVASNLIAETFKDTGLASNTVYNYTVAVTNAAGNIATSTAVPATTLPVAVNVQPVTTTATYVNLSWSNPNLGVSSVSVVRNDGVVIPVANGATTATDLAVTPNTAYSYTLTVTGVNGGTAVSPAVSTSTLPIALVVTQTTTPTTASLSWSNAANIAGGPSSITVTRNGVPVYTDATGTSVSWTDSGLVANTIYAYVITVNGQGGIAANASTNVSATTTPLAVTVGAPVVTARNVTLNWVQPVQGPLTNILVQDNGVTVKTLAGNALTSGLIPVQPKSSHSYTVVSEGLNGKATTAPALAITTPAELLVATAFTAQLTDATTMTLNWNDTSTGESGFRVEQRLNGGAWTVVNANLPGLAAMGSMSTTVPVTTSVRYDFRVTAIDNTVAPTRVGPVSASARIDLSIVPNRPATLTAALSGVGTVNLGWSDAAITNNSGYELQVQQRSAAGIWSAWTPLSETGANANTYPATGLTSGLQTRFQIRAVNPRGVSQWRVSGTVIVQ